MSDIVGGAALIILGIASAVGLWIGYQFGTHRHLCVACIQNRAAECGGICATCETAVHDLAATGHPYDQETDLP